MKKNFSHAYELFTDKLFEWYETFIKMLPNFLVAIVVMVLFFYLGKFLKRAGIRLLGKKTGNPAFTRFLAQLVAFIIGVLGLIIVLDIVNLDKTITSLLAGAGILGLAFSLAFQDAVANFVSSFFILTRKPFVTGDIIGSNDQFGKVERITMRATELIVPEGQLVIIPNKKVMENVITNYSTYGKRRVDIEIRVHYDDDPEKALALGEQAIRHSVKLLEGHTLDYFMEEFSESSLVLKFRFWIPFSTQADYLQKKSDALIAVNKTFRENGITIPYPIRTIEMGKNLVEVGNRRP